MMKYIIQSILVIFISEICLAQYEPGISRLDYTDSSGEKGKTVYIYNNSKLPYKAIWSLENGSRYSVNYHYFDPQGNMIRKEREFSDSLKTLQEFSYDARGNLLGETFKRSDGVSGSATYIYEGTRCSSVVCKSHNGWFSGTLLNQYDNKSLKVSASIMIDGKEAGKILYEYDSMQRLIREQWFFKSGFSQDYNYKYKENDCLRFNSSNIFIKTDCSSRLESEYYDFSGQGGGPSAFIYDRDNRLIKKEYSFRDTLRTVTSYDYNESGFLESSIRRFTDGREMIFRYKYDSDGRMVSREFSGQDGITGYEKYIYDENGRLTGGEYFNVDQWLTGSLKFRHDIFDKVISGDFIGKDGITSHITFSYNSSDQLEEIHWIFSSGHTQTYRFTYAYSSESKRSFVSADGGFSTLDLSGIH